MESILSITNTQGPIVDIAQDGTVTVHQIGSNEEAAKIFYESLSLYGVTLFSDLKECVTLLKRATGEATFSPTLKNDIDLYLENIRGKPYNV